MAVKFTRRQQAFIIPPIHPAVGVACRNWIAKHHKNMSELNESGSSSRRNPLIWISFAVIGLILFVFLSSDRGESITVKKSQPTGVTEGTIERSLLVPPGMRARQYIEQLRTAGKPYPLAVVFDNAERHMREGSLADAHLLYFFAAREDHVPAIMKMAEMSDPILFRAQDSLLDSADAIQAYKWYQKAAQMGYEPADAHVQGLQQWASDAAGLGNPQARQLLLNIE